VGSLPVYTYVSLVELNQIVYGSGLYALQEETAWVKTWQLQISVVLQINKSGN
jgi:hypothetical protein